MRWLLILLALAPLAPGQKSEEETRRLTDEEKIELLRGLGSEYATVKSYLPRSKKALKYQSTGKWDKNEWREAGDEYGLAGKVGDLVQVTKIEIESDRIVFQINGGFNPRGKWYEHIQAGSNMGTRPIANSKITAGTTLALVFPGRVPPLRTAEVKKMLAPLLDFEKRTATESYFASLPPEIQEAIQAKRAAIGMTREQVKMAIGQPRDRIRETKDGLETEDWIYGYPPGKITFVTFANGKVTAIKDSYAGLGGQTVPMPKPPG
jgi:hypothetical protein